MHATNTVPAAPGFVDTTLRDGLQAPGLVLAREEKCELARRLDELGLPELEIGIPSAGPEERADMAAIAALGLRARLTAWCRAMPGDLEAAGATGLATAHISFPVSARLLHALRKDTGWLFTTLNRLMPEACERFGYVSIGAQDATRADRAVLEDFVTAATRLGADRIRIADTVGVLTPSTTALLIRDMDRVCGTAELDFHAHNDFGMACANTIAAIEAGVDYVNVTVNGMGERAGNAPLEEVVMAVETLLGRPTGVRKTGLRNLCEWVARLTGQALPPDKPIVGANAFRHESGIHCAAQLEDRLSYQPIEAGTVGAEDSPFVLGIHSGRKAVAHLLERIGLTEAVPRADRIAASARALARLRRRALRMDELAALASAV